MIWSCEKIQTLFISRAICGNTAHVQWIRCSAKGSHLIHWTSAVFSRITLKWTPYAYPLFLETFWYICSFFSCSFTRKIQHGDDWERSRPQGPKNVHNFLMTVRPLSWACGYGTEMLLMLQKLFLTWLFPDIFRYVLRNVPRFCTRSICGWNLFQPLGLVGMMLTIVLLATRKPQEGDWYVSPVVIDGYRWPALK